MNAPFQPLSIVRLAEDRCQLVDGLVVRVFLQLSQPPPFGWSHLFIQSWQTKPQSATNKAGVDGDALWIECTACEVLAHLPDLEAAVESANHEHAMILERKALLETQQLYLEAKSRAELAELARQLNRASGGTDIAPEDSATEGIGFRQHALNAIRWLWRNVCVVFTGRSN